MNRIAVAKELVAAVKLIAEADRIAAASANISAVRAMIAPLIDASTGWTPQQKAQAKSHLKVVKMNFHGDTASYIVDTYTENPDMEEGYDTARWTIEIQDVMEGVLDMNLQHGILKGFGLLWKQEDDV